MNKSRQLHIAQRIHLLLMRELGQGIDVHRLLCDTLYRRDVLLVCDAHVGTDLASLAQHFRSALAEPMDEQGQPSQFAASSAPAPGSLASVWPAGASGFVASNPAHGDSALEHASRRPAPRPLWRSPSRWLGR